MSILKKGTTESKVVVSSLIYVCACGYTEMGSAEGSQSKVCPKCGETMSIISSQSGIEEKE